MPDLYRSVRQYLRIIKSYESSNDSLVLFTSYLQNKNNFLEKEYCLGKIYLPSFMLIKQYYGVLQCSNEIDEELNKLFSIAIGCSKEFYFSLIQLILSSGQNQKVDFEQEFEKVVQPIGQRLVSLLIQIKLRLLVIESESSFSMKKFFNKNYLRYLAMHFMHVTKFNKKILPYMRSEKFVYYGRVLAIMLMIKICSLCDIGYINNDFVAMCIKFIMLILVSVLLINYRSRTFYNRDISGKNLIAYNYKLFFRNQKYWKLKHNLT